MTDRGTIQMSFQMGARWWWAIFGIQHSRFRRQGMAAQEASSHSCQTKPFIPLLGRNRLMWGRPDKWGWIFSKEWFKSRGSIVWSISRALSVSTLLSQCCRPSVECATQRQRELEGELTSRVVTYKIEVLQASLRYLGLEGCPVRPQMPGLLGLQTQTQGKERFFQTNMNWFGRTQLQL